MNSSAVSRGAVVLLGAALVVMFVGKPLPAQTSAAAKAPVTFTAEQDHQNMMDQLGIKALRPGASGDEGDPNHANYDETKANPFPNYPDPLTLKNGQKVTSADVWWKQRQPEIVEDLEREVVGRVPKDVPRVTWTVTKTVETIVGNIPVVAKQLSGHVDNSLAPSITVDISAVEVVPANAHGPVPVLMMFARPVLPPPAPPTTEEAAQLDAGLKALLANADPKLKAILDKYPDYNLVANPRPAPVFVPGAPIVDPPATTQLIADGWGYVLISPSSIQADNGAGLTRGVIGLVNKGQPRKPDDWGALRAWGWGAARALDYLETDPAVDAKHVGIEGVSRYGKAALITMALEPRFAMVLIGSSGEGGVKPHRRNFGEEVENLTGTGGYHWMAGNFLKYGASEASFGSKNAGDIPVDSPELLALCAPRLTFVSYGIPQNGDAKWLDQHGSFMATVAAQSVFRLLGDRDMGVSDDYHNVVMPPVDEGLLRGQLAWRQHDGGHTDAPNVRYFIQWTDKFIQHKNPNPFVFSAP
jgi:hypothetical protein